MKMQTLYIVLSCILVLVGVIIFFRESVKASTDDIGQEVEQLFREEEVETVLGDWELREEDSIVGEHGGDSFYIAPREVDHFIYSAEITVEEGAAGALVFRYQNHDKTFAVNVDAREDVVRYWRDPDGIVEDYETEIENGETYNLQVQVVGRNLKVFLDGEMVMDIDDYSPGGRVGLNVFSSTVSFENIKLYELDIDNRYLTDLQISENDLSPGFEQDILKYTATVEQETDKIKLDTSLKKDTKEVKIDGQEITREDSSVELELAAGENTVLIEEKVAEDYWLTTTVNIYRKPENHYQEEYRPQYHFTPEKDWLNDPNGLVYYEDEYHLFYQYHPHSRDWGPMHWGHATSKDLVHWEQQPVALYPDELGTIFSGSAVVDKDDTSGFFNGQSGLVAVFTHATGYEGQMQSIAYSKDKGRTWELYEDNPVIPNSGDVDFRDPKVFWYEETEKWIMIVAGGQVRIYSSPDLKNWELESKSDIHTECPDLFELPVDGNPEETKWILNAGGRNYYIGEFDGREFEPETEEITLNYGPDSYAAQTFDNLPTDNSRRVMVNWMADWETILDTPTDPWRGGMTLPHELSLKTIDGQIRLIQEPISELNRLRKNEKRWENIKLNGQNNLLSEIQGKALEIKAEFEIGDVKELGFNLFQGDQDKIRAGYLVQEEKMFVDRRDSGNDFSPRIFKAPLKPENNRIQLHIYIDHSTVEVFGNGGQKVISALTFPETANDNLELYVKDGQAELISLEIYELDSIW